MISRNSMMMTCVVLTATLTAAPAFALIGPLTGSLSTPDGITGFGEWVSPPPGSGYEISWEVTQTSADVWHYEYWISEQESDDPVRRLTSHVIFQVTEDPRLTDSDIWNIFGHGGYEVRTYGPTDSGSPGLPGEVFGLKIDLTDGQSHFGFDSSRIPWWADFYAKDGNNPPTYCYNSDFGVDVANIHDYANAPVDASGQILNKILAPNTPEPSSLLLLAFGAVPLMLRRRQRA